MEKKKYIFPIVEIVSYKAKNIMKAGSPLPPDPGTNTSIPHAGKQIEN